MARKVNQETINLIKQWEGLKLTAYKPHKDDVWTIGYGHTSAAGEPFVREGMTITAAEALKILKNDLVQYESAVEKCVTAPLTDSQFGALVSLCYNIGPENLRKSSLVKKLNKGDYEGAQDQFRVWRKSSGKVMQGLVNRRAQEAALFGRGGFVTSNYVEAKPAAEPVLTKENVAWGATIVGSVGTAASGEGGFFQMLGNIFSGDGSIQDALAFVIVAGFIIGATAFIWKRVKAG